MRKVPTCLPAGRFTETQIVTVLQKAEQGHKVADLCFEPAWGRQEKVRGPVERRAVAVSMVVDHGISVVQASKATGVARSTNAYKPKPKDDSAWIELFGALVERYPAIGFDNAYARIRRKGHLVTRRNSTASTPPMD
jgi:hypothetical protein